MLARRTIRILGCSRVHRWAGLRLATVVLATVATTPGFAEGNTATMMSPPSPIAAHSPHQSENGLPENAETSTDDRPGASLARLVTSPRDAARPYGPMQLQPPATDRPADLPREAG